MNKKSFLWILLICCTFISAETDLSKKARAYFDAGDFERAISSYQSLLKDQSDGIRKEILTYNLGTAYLADGQYQQAIDQFFRIVSSEKQVPKHLLERTHFNLIIGYLDLTDHCLDHLDAESPMTSIRDAQRSLGSAKERYLTYKEIKYPFLIEEDFPQELMDLTNSFKELSSKLKRIEKEVIMSSLTFSKGLQNLLHTCENRLLYLDSYLQADLKESQKKFLLTKQYLSEREQAPFWKRMQEIIQKQYEEAEKEVLHKDKVSQQQDENFELQSAFYALFDQANNRHQLGLDYLKERKLFQSRSALAKAQLDLKLMVLSEQNQDTLEYCLKEKISMKNKKTLFEQKLAFASSLGEEIAHHNSMAIGLTSHIDEKIQAYKSPSRDKKTFSKLEELKKIDELDVVHQIIMRLKTRLEEEENPSLDKLEKDYYLYQITKKKPDDYLVEAYQKLKKDSPLKKLERTQLDHQLFALHNHLEIQHNFSYEEEKNKRIDYALNHLPQIQDHLAKNEVQEAGSLMQKVLINWNYKRYLASEMEEIAKAYPPLLEKITFSKDEVEHLKELNQELLLSYKSLEDQELHQETFETLQAGFEKVEESNQLALRDSFKNQVQKLLLKNGKAGLERMVRKFKEDKVTSSEILKEGIKEEKMSLSLTSESGDNNPSPQEDLSALQSLAGDSQSHPLSAVEKFEEAFYDEEAEASSQSGQATRNSEVLKYFKAGRAEAEHAWKLLQREQIKWDKVVTHQELAIEYWERALKAYQQSSQNQDPNPNQDSSGQGESQQDVPSPEQSAGAQNENISQMDEGEMESPEKESLREILQKLQEMQQDDQIRPPRRQTPKKGLRPW